jgi:Transposase IS116/IS110/IS902 family
MLLAEIGRDISRFRTDAQLASWGGMCPASASPAASSPPPPPAKERSGYAAP